MKNSKIKNFLTSLLTIQNAQEFMITWAFNTADHTALLFLICLFNGAHLIKLLHVLRHHSYPRCHKYPRYHRSHSYKYPRFYNHNYSWHSCSYNYRHKSFKNEDAVELFLPIIKKALWNICLKKTLTPLLKLNIK